MPTPCYLIEQTDRALLSLRRFGFGPSAAEPDRHECPGRPPTTGHGGSVYRYGCDGSSGYLEEIPLVLSADGYLELAPEPPHDDPRWPATCEHCGEPFSHDELWQANQEPVYVVVAAVPGAALDVGMETPLRDAPPGAMWFAAWLREWSIGFDGCGLMVRLPDGHDWRVDGEATNCTRKGDRTHRCWLREGEPPYVTAGKHPHELTCSAGAGSIASPGYHGFLQNGILT